MKTFKNYIAMFVIFSTLFTMATLSLELIEGYKITTTAYYGLKNIGVGFIFFIYIFCTVAYMITFLPLTFFVNKYIKPLILRIVVFSFVGGICGIWAFNNLYGFANGSLIAGYELNTKTAIILYTLAGLIYSIFDYYFNTK